ncbi:prenyltransferase/squalene oxidase repeat-containing protein [Natronolimnobius baerhuensis]|uniref:Antibiotic ABC transporter permease n=1 Tax=Natronolimnobius baerhuensis TaxID=253108 RepID=A0A202EDY0_9EURY|nr:antibiotic ABC transporter permease [Natronolimnobius baerhuensis]OVE86431.1 antibiotic ABC transporter permease [Natronolimnobius baerhuensis]
MQSQGLPEPTTQAETDDRPRAVDHYLSVLDSTLAYARRRDYSGPDYGDGMSSQLLQAAPVENRFVNLVVQELVKRTPVNIRPLLRVEDRRNYKGTALFTMANLNFDTYTSANEEVERRFDPRAEADHLAQWLVNESLEGYSGFCGGHRHEIQHFHTKGVPSDPDIVSTAYGVKALVQATEHGLGNEYAEIARTAVDFLIEELNYREVDEGAKIDYHLNHPDDSYTLNSAALGAGMLIDLYEHFGDEDLRERATKILDHVAANQTDIGGWPYRIPADASHLSMDSHHNGFIIEVFQRYRDVIDAGRYSDTLEEALEFYREELFELDGAPNFDESNAYPRDIHASTQGILVFTREGDLEFADRILRWVLANLQVEGEEGRFYYRQYRHHMKRVTLMRWCQGWMSYAMSEFLLACQAAGGQETALDSEIDVEHLESTPHPNA